MDGNTNTLKEKLTHIKKDKTKGCIAWIIILIILYLLPSAFDVWPDIDSYIGGYGPLGIWGTIILTFAAIGLSIGYGMTCIHGNTVYRMAGWGWKDGELPIFFPDGFDADLKKIYYDELMTLDIGWTTHHPFSAFNKKLAELNDKYLYNSKL